MNPEIEQLKQHLAALEQRFAQIEKPGGYLFRKDVKLGLSQTRVLVGAIGSYLGFFGTDPLAQITPAGENVMALNGGTAATNLNTWTGSFGSTAYTIGDVVFILKKHGLLKK